VPAVSDKVPAYCRNLIRPLYCEGTLSASPRSRQVAIASGSAPSSTPERSRLRHVRGKVAIAFGSAPSSTPERSRLRPDRDKVAIAFGSAPRSRAGRSRLCLDRDRSPLPLARLRGQHHGALDSQGGHDSQLLSYKPFNQFQHFYQYRPEFKISTSLIIGRYQRFPYSTRERPIGRSLVTDPSLLEHMNEQYLIQREVPATHREARQHAQTAGFWLHLSSLPLSAE